MLVHGIGVEVSGGLKIEGWWGFHCCCFFILLQRETCLTSEIGEIGIQKTLVIILFLVNMLMHHEYAKLYSFYLSSHRKNWMLS